MSEGREIVCLGRYWEPSEPLFLKSVLEAHGIEAFVAGEYLGNITGHLGLFGGSPSGGVELRVFADDAQLAAEILEGSPQQASCDEEE